MIATAAATAYWTPTPADLPHIERKACEYWASVDAPQRAWVVEAVLAFGADVTSALEIGCQAGPNLRALRRARPDLRLVGVDVNAPALVVGRRLIAEAQLRHIDLVDGAVPEILDRWPDGSVDVVLSTYCLAYIGPDRIEETVRACLRVARVGLVLIEPMLGPGHADETTVEGSTYVEWRHDYLALLQAAIAAQQLHARIAWLTKPPVDRLAHVLIVRKEVADAV